MVVVLPTHPAEGPRAIQRAASASLLLLGVFLLCLFPGIATLLPRLAFG